MQVAKGADPEAPLPAAPKRINRAFYSADGTAFVGNRFGNRRWTGQLMKRPLKAPTQRMPGWY